MTIVRITPSTPGCYGICCPKHRECQRYAAVEGRTQDHVMGTCATPEGELPLFTPKEPS